MHATARTGFSLYTVAATIRGYCRHFTAQWRESVAHASGHEYGDALTHTNKYTCICKYIHTEMNTFNTLALNTKKDIGLIVKYTTFKVISLSLGSSNLVKLCWCKLNMQSYWLPCKVFMQTTHSKSWHAMIHLLSIASVVRVGQRSYFICGECSLLELLNVPSLVGCILHVSCVQGSMCVYML